VLSIGKLGHGQADYYLQAVAQGVEDYYSGAGEAPGEWLGLAAAELDVSGEVEGDALYAALNGIHPTSGDLLAGRRGTASRVPGFDLTFSAPKSVSVLFGLADERTSAEVRNAHEAAVHAALGYMERQAAVARRGPGGSESVLGNGFVAAAFRHRTSRAGDPQLHTHVLVANMTRAHDGRWTALDARRLYAHAKTGGYLYQAELRTELTRRLAVEWTPVRNGLADISGVPAPVLRAFSRRRVEIEHTMAERGEHSATAAQIATLDTRQAKDYGVSPDSLVERWRERAKRLGLDRPQLAAVIGQATLRTPDAHEAEAASDELAAPQGLTRRRASFTRRDVIQAWCERLPHGEEVAAIEALADRFLGSGRTVTLAQDVRRLTHSDVVRRADGRVVAATAEERRHSTPELLATERRLIDGAIARRGAGVAVVDKATVEEVLRSRPSLSAEQAQMVRRLTREGDGVQVVVGKAGAGKTFALDAARDAWQQAGHQVIGAAVARRAARELEDGAGIQSTSLAALLADLREGGDHGLAQYSVVVVDEASMAGTRQLAELLAHAQPADAKVVLVGDDRQLPEIDAGGAFSALIGRTDAIELSENRRQHEAWERAALDELRAGRPEEAIERYRAHGRVVLGENASAVRDQLVSDWWHARPQGDATMVAVRRDDVSDLNARARALMRAAGQLGPDQLRVASRDFATGDHVVLLKNAPRLGATNGTRGMVTDIDSAATKLTLRTTEGRDVRLPASYLEATTEHGGPTLDHGYAITGHKAQGITTARTFVLGTDDLYREWGYVAMSRGAVENRLYVVAPHPRERDEYAPEGRRRDPLDAVTAALKYSRAQTAALDVAAREGISQATTTDLIAERSRLAGRIGGPHRSDPRARRRVAAQRAQAERAAEEAGARVAEAEEGSAGRHSHAKTAPHRAIQSQARERARQLADREDDLTQVGTAHSTWLASRAEDITRYAALGDELDRRRHSAARAAIVEKPAYLVAELGPCPDRPAQRRAWDRAAIRIEMYRQDFGVAGAESALGEEPRELGQRSAWRQARLDVERVRREVAVTLDHRSETERGIG
jgi:conjugative relaxase-like TrwC/TraI family protein